MNIRQLAKPCACALLWLPLLGFQSASAAETTAAEECSVMAVAETPSVPASDSLEVFFRVNRGQLDMDYANNRQIIQEFVRKVNAHFGHIPASDLQLDIYTGASPEGTFEVNKRLGEERGRALKQVLEKEFNGRIGNINVYNQGPRWGGLYQMIKASDEPWKKEVLNILSSTGSEENYSGFDPREAQLRALKGGKVWKTLLNKYLPSLRSSGSAVVAPITEHRADTIYIYNKDTVYYMPEPCPPYVEEVDHTRVWAIKTNLLLWGVIAPNVQVEIPLGFTNRWSLEAEVFWPWWIWDHNAHAEQFGNVGLEARYWLGNRDKHKCLDGWHLGLGVGVGYYDFEWKRSDGYQGEYVNAYFNIGYQHRFGKHWAIDGGLGLGWIGTKYRHYLGSSTFPVGHEEEFDDHLMWQKTSSRHIFGLTHANVTIAYTFNIKDKTHKYQPKGYDYVAKVADSNDDLKASKARKAEAKAAEKAAKERAKAEKAEAKAAKKVKAPKTEKAPKAEKKVKAPKAPKAEKAPKAPKPAKVEAPKAEKKVLSAEQSAKAEAKARKAAEKARLKAEKEEAKRAYAAEKAARKAAEKAAKSNSK